ncbi:hypothetical protein J5N97_005333 [Dioscorea zingiberensis]|uniref:WRKY domain-containing protein n=1 Tax=Dioscorea zingiberensis TaxID=325984 RepID=A0A9D5D9N3_9LILI|nr:hypothetical protein J5N97_005333 [Dioscorea zingiberensis]
MDDISVIGDWPPAMNPSPRTLISNFLNGEFSLKPVPLVEDVHDVMKGDERKLDTCLKEKEDDGFQFSSGPSMEPSKLDVHKPSPRCALSERRPAWAGFSTPKINTTRVISANLNSSTSEVRSPYITISPGLSPTTLLDSPVFLSNMAQPSPTTGKLFYDRSNGTELVSTSTIPDKDRDHALEKVPELFVFKPHPQTSSYFSSADNKQTMMSIETTAIPSWNQNDLNLQASLSDSSDGEDPSEKVSLSNERSPPLNDRINTEADPRDEYPLVVTSGQADDGYSWRKYGQKPVKGSDYPRSYYKCTHLNCPIKKKVERSHEGHITKIIYKGVHNHTKPPPNDWSTAPNSLENPVYQAGLEGNLLKMTSQSNDQYTTSEFGDPSIVEIARDVSSILSSDEEDDQAARGSVALGCDGEGDEMELKRRKVDTGVMDMSAASRVAREPRVVVQTTSEIDILDDGYRWRKYGQKVVKGNPNPRSYYKCTNLGCTVRKHVERASHDLRSVITTYEGKHNHEVPAARGSNHSNSASSTTSTTTISHPHGLHRRPELTLAQDSLMTLNGSANKMVTMPGNFTFAMRQQGLNNLGVMGLSTVTPMKVSDLHQVHPYFGHQQVDNTGFMMPKEEPKQMPLQESGQTKQNAAASLAYHQMMSRLQLGNHQL